MYSRILTASVGAVLLTSLAGCGSGGGSGGGGTATPQSVRVPIVISDASTEDWSTIGVKVLSISLLPQGGGNPVTVYTAPSPAPVSNLAQLDAVAELVNTASIPAGKYVGAQIVISANPGDVTLTVAPDPEAGFDGTPSTTIPSSQIDIQGAQGPVGSQTVTIHVKLDPTLNVSASQTIPVNLEFDLGHPAFIIEHMTPTSSGPVWAVNFNGGPVHDHPVRDITHLLLRHMYGTVSSVASDNTSITIAKDLPTIPVVSPETAVPTGESVTILADASYGTIFYDVDAQTQNIIKDFSSEAATLNGKYVRVQARYQPDGSLVATRIWASATFNSVWVSPEGHVVHVDTADSQILVTNDQGHLVPITVDSGTQFFFPIPGQPSSLTTPIATGPAFLGAPNFVRGFKVHVSVVDPNATPLVAQNVDIESAMFDGRISNANATGATFNRGYATFEDGYSVTLPYISSATANGTDGSGNPVNGFKYWNFAYPTVIDSGANAVNDFIAAAGDSVDFGGTVGKVVARGFTNAVWGDPANTTGWAMPWTVMMPTRLPRGTVATGLAGNSFTMNAYGGTNAATVDVSTTPGAATLVYQVDRSSEDVTVTPEDITTSAGLAALTAGLAVGAPVRVYGLPQADGTLKAYTVVYFTGTMPSD